jgi:hypothetical protein
VGAIHRHVPLRDRHLAAERDHERMGKHHVGDAHMNDSAIDRPLRGDPQPIRCFLGLQPRVGRFTQQARHRDVRADRRGPKLPAVDVPGGILVFKEAVKEARMSWVDPDLQRLQPIAGPQTLECKNMTVGCNEGVEPGERRGLSPIGVKLALEGIADLGSSLASGVCEPAMDVSVGAKKVVQAASAGNRVEQQTQGGAPHAP